MTKRWKDIRNSKLSPEAQARNDAWVAAEVARIKLTMRHGPEKYTYRVIWSEDDQAHVGLCAEFPSLSWLAPSHGEALDGIVKVVGDVLKDMVKRGETPPEPLSLRE